MNLNQLNYKHLHYFWVVAKTGSITKAAERLHVTPQTISGQLSDFEDRMGATLFTVVGRKIEITAAGETALAYADEIFSLGQSMIHALQETPDEQPLAFRVGISDAVPKMLAYQLLKPALSEINNCRLSGFEGRFVDLMADLSVQRLDLVISDTSAQNISSVRAFNHILGQSQVACFATTSIKRTLKKKFPDCLHQTPFIYPSQNSSLRPRLDQWFNDQGIQPKLIAEFDDGAMIKAFGQAGVGVFCAPLVLADTIKQQYQANCIGICHGLHETFYGISLQRRVSHPAVKFMINTAKFDIFTDT